MTENVAQTDMEPFQNPDCLPLEKLKLHVKTNGVHEAIPALDKKWAEERYFLHYEAPMLYNDNGSAVMGAKEHWMEIVTYIVEDLNWLLSLPFYRFWSTVRYNTSTLDTLVSFLQEAPPFFALEHFPNEPDMLEQLETLRHLVLIVFARLVTNKESSSEYMSNSFLGSLLYDNYIITVPIIYDLCQLYGRDNAETVKRIMQSLFKLQPLYDDDLEKSVPYFIEALNNVQQKLGKGLDFFNDEVDFLVENGMKSREMSLAELEDLIIYVLDIFSSISVLLKTYVPAVNLFHHENFMNKVVSIYENTIPEMYLKLEELAHKDESIGKYIELKHYLDVSRVELLELYRTVIYSPILEASEKLDTLSEAEVKEYVDGYLITLINNVITVREFVTDYNRLYPVQSDLDYLSLICPELDTIKCDYILQSIRTTTGGAIVKKQAPLNNVHNNMHNDIAVAGSSNDQSEPIASSSKESPSYSPEKSIIRDSVELASLVTEVKDIFSHLGEGFIQMCLKHYNYDTASVINAVLEDNLPPDLKKVDYSLPYIPPDPMETPVVTDLALGVQRLNVFDNDEFDIMTRDSIDTSKIHIGKRKDKYKNVNELLNDKTHIKGASDIYNKYNLVADDYDDEYDDTYDSHDVRGFVQDDTVEADSRPFTVPRILRAANKCDAASEDESEDEEKNQPNEQNGGHHFVQNPAELRAKAEQKRLAARGGKTSSNTHHDVVGKAKGKGQDKEVLHNRHQKGTHKATHANHNRRSGAQWKRRQGMVPS